MWVEPEFVNRIECLKIYYIKLTIKDMLALSIGQDLPRKSAGVVEEVGVGDVGYGWLDIEKEPQIAGIRSLQYDQF